jgi:uncharacterized protein (DUF1810 family)
MPGDASPVRAAVMPADPYDLARFVTAQEGVYEAARGELRAGRKRGHWMWFIFPQVEGLGHSPTARKFAIASLDEARAYLAHRVLGPRLVECAGLVLAITDRSVEQIFGYPDNLKLCSSMTLFDQAAPDQSVFAAVLQAHFGGVPDPLTLDRLAGR